MVRPLCEFKVGDRVRLVMNYGMRHKGDEYTVMSTAVGTDVTPNDTYLLELVDSNDKTLWAFQYRFEKVENKVEEKTAKVEDIKTASIKVADIKWRTVGYREWVASDTNVPYRQTTIDGGDTTFYELGTVPVELPTKPGAIVGPIGDNPEGYNPYVLGGQGDWYELDEFVAPFKETADTVQGYLDSGEMEVLFEGIGNSSWQLK